MADIKDENKAHIKPDPTPLLLAEVEVRQNDPKQPHPKKTAGEHAFDRIVYTGIGFGVNEASSLVIADQFEHGIGKKGFQAASDWLIKTFKIADQTGAKGVTAKQKAGNLLMTAGLLTAGTLLLWPMKYLEDNKSHWVKKANHAIDRLKGSNLTEEEIAARDAEAEKTIACEPKQSWPSLLIGRVVAVASGMFFSQKIMGTDRNAKVMDFSEKLLTGSVQKVNPSRWHRYARLIGLETILCTMTSVVLEASSKFYAKRGTEVHDPEICTQVVHQEAPRDTKAIAPAAPLVKTEEPAATGQDLTKYKKSAITATESHTAMVQKTETTRSLAT